MGRVSHITDGTWQISTTKGQFQLYGVTEKTAKSVRRLIDAQPGEQFKVREKRKFGEIKPLNKKQRKKFRKNEEYRRNQQAALNGALYELAFHVGQSEQNPELLKALFVDSLSHLSPEDWDRRISEELKVQLKASLQTQNDEQLYAKLGNQEGEAVGCSGSYRIWKPVTATGQKDVKALFKPSDEEPESAVQPTLKRAIWRFVKLHLLWPLLGSVPDMNGGTGYVAEKVQYDFAEWIAKGIEDYARVNHTSVDQLARELGVDPLELTQMVPEVKIAKMTVRGEEKAGSLMTWEPNCQMMHEFLEVDRHLNGPVRADRKLNPVSLDLGMVLRYGTGNTDDHAGNILIRDGKTVRWIDGGRSMPTANPTGANKLMTKNSFLLWRKMGTAQTEFGPLAKHVIGYLDQNRDAIAGQIRTTYNTNVDGGGKVEQRIAAMNERLDVLVAFANHRGEGWTKGDLAHTITTKQMKAKLRAASVA